MCGCFPQPFAEVVVSRGNGSTSDGNNNQDKPVIQTRRLYVSGAVTNDGYVEVPQICDYKTVLETVGIVDYSVLPTNLSDSIPGKNESLIINFYQDGRICYSVNVNGLFVTSRLSVDGVDSDIINKIADYIQNNGVIKNRSQLKLALGDDYDENFYKFYIDETDYAQDC